MKNLYRWIASHPRASKILLIIPITVFCFFALDPSVYSFGIRFLIIFSLLSSALMFVNTMPDKLMRRPLAQLEQNCDPYPFLEELEIQIATPQENFQGQMILINYAMALVHTGQNEKALEILEGIEIDRYPSASPFAKFIYYNNLCDVMTRLGRYPEANIWYERACQIYRNLPNNRFKQRLERTVEMNEIENLYRDEDYAYALRRLAKIPCPTQRSLMDAALLAAKCNLGLGETEKAREKLLYVIDNGNRLHCVTVARELLATLS